MRAAIVCGGPPIGGKEIMALELGVGLRNNDCTVEFVTSKWTNGDFKKRLDILGIPSYQVWFGFISATLTWDCMVMTAHQVSRWPHLFVGYYRFLRRYTPEKVIHTNWHSILMILPFLKPARDIFWIHEVIPDKPHYRRVFGWFARRLGCFVAVSHAVAESLRRIGIPDEKIQVVHNGIADPNADRGALRRHERSVRIGIIGRVGEWKGHKDLLNAFALVATQHPNAELHIFGTGATGFEAQLKQCSINLGIAARVLWHGFVANQAQIYPNLEICVVPSRCADSLPTVAIEAAYYGLPVVATKRGGLPEIVEDEITGFLCNADDPQDIARKLDILLSNPELRQQMGMTARKRAELHFSQARFVREFVKLLNG